MIAYTKMTPKWQILEGKLEAVMTPLVKGRNFFNDDEVQELFPDHEDEDSEESIDEDIMQYSENESD